MNAILKQKIETGISNFTFNSNFCLEAIPEEEKTELQLRSKLIKLPKKSILYSEGEPPKGIYILVKGKVKMSQLNPDGSVQILFIYGVGEVFGHRSILGGDNQPASITALEECELMFIEKEHFLNVVHNSSKMSKLLMQSMSHEFTVLVNRINIFAQRGIKERLALFLLLLNETYRIPGQLNEDAEITVNRNDLASYTGTSVENLVRTLKVFKEQNYVRTNGKSIFIENFEALYTLAGI